MRAAESKLHRLKVAIDALTNAKTAVSNGFGIGMEHVDRAIEDQRAALLAHMEAVADVDGGTPPMSLPWRHYSLKATASLAYMLAAR